MTSKGLSLVVILSIGVFILLTLQECACRRCGDRINKNVETTIETTTVKISLASRNFIAIQNVNCNPGSRLVNGRCRVALRSGMIGEDEETDISAQEERHSEEEGRILKEERKREDRKKQEKESKNQQRQGKKCPEHMVQHNGQCVFTFE